MSFKGNLLKPLLFLELLGLVFLQEEDLLGLLVEQVELAELVG